ncbi:hypothetical protein CGLO_15251 [Colletotrichum gloeosporioides Cg-14]|uniref:Uncharacterized protein n=1 Tax=Colletotrichum gloeosporioides (strain Cg-14) TaxID=1237896 RepID=T0JRD8_COLGC|nr:hypothetical protein CGLO_15251 [Colletotrichum gloeosporioides Cg-14]
MYLELTYSKEIL